jgi:hypothetical protein
MPAQQAGEAPGARSGHRADLIASDLMNLTRMARAAVPAVALGTLMTPGNASAATTWWYSGGPQGSGAAATFHQDGDQLRLCDVNSDGYRALADVQTAAGEHLYRLTDSYNDDQCTTVSAADGHNLAEGRSYRLRVCVSTAGESPSYCKTYDDAFYNGQVPSGQTAAPMRESAHA